MLTPIASGQEISDSISVGQSESDTFTAAAGETVRIAVGEINNFSSGPDLQVFGPEGVIETDFGADSASVEFVASGGNYTAVVSDRFNDQRLDYRVRLLILPGSPQPLADRDGAAADEQLSNGEEAIGSLPVGAFNVHRFSAQVGRTVRIAVGEIGNLSSGPRLDVYGPDGTLAFSDFSGSDDAAIEFTASASGNYTAVVSDFSNDQRLDYRIRLLTVPGNPTRLADRDGDPADEPLANGEEAIASLPIGAYNVHRFSAQPGQTVRVAVGEIGNLSSGPRLDIYAPDGTLAFSDSSGSDDAAVVFTASAGGTYTAVVADAFGDQRLDYRIRLLTVPGNPARLSDRDGADADEALSNNETATASLPIGAFNIHRFDAVAGATARVAVGEVGNFSSGPLLEVYAPIRT